MPAINRAVGPKILNEVYRCVVRQAPHVRVYGEEASDTTNITTAVCHLTLACLHASKDIHVAGGPVQLGQCMGWLVTLQCGRQRLYKIVHCAFAKRSRTDER